MSTMTYHVNWFEAVGIHAGRILKRWSRSASVLVSAIGMPVVMIVLVNVLFGGMIEQFTGAEMNMSGISVMVAVSSAFTGAMMGAGAIVQERHEGIPVRLATLPGPQTVGFTGRIVAETLRALVTVFTAVIVGLLYGADFGSATSMLWLLVVLVFVALSAGCVGVMLGYIVDTPQGAVSFAPLIMAAMFFNTAMMPRDMYAEVLRPIVDVSPVTAVTELVTSIINHDVTASNIVVFLAWFGGLILLSLLILSRKVVTRRN